MAKWKTPWSILLIQMIVVLREQTFAADQSLFFPYGASEGDTFLPANDDGSTDELPITVVFPYFDHDHSSLFVNNNGVISFLQRVSQFTPDPFPLGNDRRLITPFWGDVDTRNGGNLSYREIVRFNQNEDIFQEADGIIRNAYVNMRRFTSSWMYIATWDNVAYYGSTSATIPNSFQAVLVTDGQYSFAIFNYGDINWTTGTASGGDASTGLGGTPAQVGFNAGDGVTFYSVPESRTPAVVDIEETSNIGLPGRWVFRTDNSNIEGLECTISGSISLFPLVGTMLGGTQVFITGPCFNSTNDIVCNFNDTNVSGKLLSNTTALCITPTFFKIGRIPLTVSLDGGSSFNFQGVFTVLNVEDVPVSVISDATESNNELTSISITWDTETLGYVDLVDIVVFGYQEDQDDIIFQQVLVLDESVSYLQGHATLAVSYSTVIYFEVGVIGVSESQQSQPPINQPAATLWSEVHVLQWLRGINSQDWCTLWIGDENHRSGDFIEARQACPCTLTQAFLDIARFSPHPKCDIDSTSPNNCADKPGAVHCIRANTPSEEDGGQECCYDSDEFIINVDISMGGGYSHRYHHDGISPYEFPTKVPYLSHFVTDILPWTYCCRFRSQNSIGSNLCYIYGIKRPSQVCEGYVPPPPALGNGDPHIATLDGNMYTFNGHGEYILLDAMNSTFVLQARSAPLTGAQATVFVAVAACFGNSDVIHVQTSERRILDAYVRLHNENEFSRIEFEQAQRWSYTGVSVTGRNISSNGILVVFDGGVALELRAAEGAMSILFVAPESFNGRTRGLMGTWNGSPSDDFTTPNGTLVPSNSSTLVIHYQFGLLWEIQANHSLFFYEPGTSHETHTDNSYTPVFEPVVNPAVNQTLVAEVCGTNQFCIFDFQTTGSESFAQASIDTFEQYEAAVDSTTLAICPGLSLPANGSAVVTRYSEGGVAKFTCNDGFELSENVSLTCQANGKWTDDDVPVCKEVSPPVDFDPSLPTWAIILICVVAALVLVTVIVIFIRCLCCSTTSKVDPTLETHENPTFVKVDPTLETHENPTFVKADTYHA